MLSSKLSYISGWLGKLLLCVSRLYCNYWLVLYTLALLACLIAYLGTYVLIVSFTACRYFFYVSSLKVCSGLDTYTFRYIFNRPANSPILRQFVGIVAERNRFAVTSTFDMLFPICRSNCSNTTSVTRFSFP